MRMVCAVGVLSLGAVLVGGGPAVGAVAGPEADLAYHGYVAVHGGRVDVRLTPRNHGPNPVADATVRLRWSTPLHDQQRLPARCARAGQRTVVCRTGALPVDGLGEEIRVKVRLRGVSAEVSMTVDTVWGGGSVDRNHANDRQRVLALDTGDSYAF
ncbi:hypothetical protein [Streptomyces sp. NPDC005141]